MNQDARKAALRMIPYGASVRAADDGNGNAADTVLYGDWEGEFS